MDKNLADIFRHLSLMFGVGLLVGCFFFSFLLTFEIKGAWK